MTIKEIEDFPGYYVSDDGRVFSVKDDVKKELRQNTQTNGYRQVGLHKDGEVSKRLVHRLVASAFIPNPENKSEVNHKNGVKSDNRVENLEWATRRENILHMINVLYAEYFEAKKSLIESEREAKREAHKVYCLETRNGVRKSSRSWEILRCHQGGYT